MSRTRRGIGSAAALSGLLLCLALPAQAATGERTKLAVLDVAARGDVDPKRIEGLSSLLASEASRRADLAVTSGSEIRAMVGFDRQRELLGCSDASCLAEIGGALGVSYILASEVTIFGGKWLLTLALVDIRTAQTVRRLTKQADSEAEVLDVSRLGVAELLTALDRAGPLEAGGVGTAAPEPAGGGRSLLSWAGVAVGGASVLVGGGLYAGAFADASEPLLPAEGDAVRAQAGLGLGLMLGGAAVAAASFFLFPDDAPAPASGAPVARSFPVPDGPFAPGDVAPVPAASGARSFPLPEGPLAPEVSR